MQKYRNGKYVELTEQEIQDRQTTQAEVEAKAYEECKPKKKAELSKTCGEIIDKGITFEGKQYSCRLEDSAEIITLADKILSKIEIINQSDVTEEEKQLAISELVTAWHADGEPCVVWNGLKFLEFAQKIQEHITWNKTYLGGLKALVDRKRTIDTVNAIKYGDELPEDIMANVLATLEALK